jgi:hypothetical protein
VMDNASLTISGSGQIAGNTVQGGQSPGASTNGSAAGSGIFLQGSGVLNFDQDAADIFTIADDIMDETGAVKSGKATVIVGATDPNGLPTGGGTGIWSISQAGTGKVNITGHSIL